MKSLFKTIVPMLLVMLVVACHPNKHTPHHHYAACAKCDHCAECQKTECACCKTHVLRKCHQETHYEDRAGVTNVTPSCPECVKAHRTHALHAN